MNLEEISIKDSIILDEVLNYVKFSILKDDAYSTNVVSRELAFQN